MSDFRWLHEFWSEAWGSFFLPVMQSIAMLLFVIMAIPLGVLCLLLSVLALIFYGFYVILEKVPGALSVMRVFANFFWCCCSHVWIPFCGALAGCLTGVCAGEVGMFVGSLFGLSMGVIFEMIRITDCHQTYPRSSWLTMLPYDEGYHQIGQQGNDHQRYNGDVKISHERPWTWKGFQTALGPKEDDVLRKT